MGFGFDELIAHPKVWKLNGRSQQWKTISTGFDELDRCLPGGGWPCHAITEVFFRCDGMGEVSLFMPALVQSQPRSIVWVAPPHIPYAPALFRAGLDLSRMLLVHPDSEQDVPWAVEQVLQSQDHLTVLAWIGRVDQTALRRLQLKVEAHRAWAVFFRPMRALRQKSPAALKLYLERRDGAMHVEILKCRGGKPAVVALPDDGRGG
jgi:hypothetical protein